MKEFIEVPTLTTIGCRLRQQRLKSILRQKQLKSALICDRRHVFYFTGFWCRPIYAPIVLIEVDGLTILSAPFSPTCEIASDQLSIYESNRMATLVDDQWTAALKPLLSHIPADQFGSDGFLPIGSLDSKPSCDLPPGALATPSCKRCR